MNINKMKLWATSLIIFSCLPAVSEAYFTTNQKAIQVNQNSAFYTITYSFGFSDRELYMPIIALREVMVPEKGLYAGYTLVNEDNETLSKGTMSGIILTSDDVEIKNNQYYVPAGHSAEFTLVTLLTVPEGESLDKVSVLMSQLPFTMVDEDTEISAHLNPSELQYYRTPALSF